MALIFMLDKFIKIGLTRSSYIQQGGACLQAISLTSDFYLIQINDVFEGQNIETN